MRTFKGCLGLLPAMLLAIAWAPRAPAQDFRRGDVNVDGRVDMADVENILLAPIWQLGFPCESAADADGSGAINPVDAVRIMNVLFLGIGAIPAPGPKECGPAGGSDLPCAEYPPGICQSLPLPPLDPRFELRIEAPGAILGEPGAVKSAEALVQLCNQTAVHYWSLAVSAEGCEIASVTTDGTLAGPVSQGGLSKGDGFLLSEVIDPARNGGKRGAVSAVFLSFAAPTEIPATGIGDGCTPNSILKLGVSALVPEGGSGSCVLAFTDGLIGSGQPVNNLVNLPAFPTRVTRPSRTGATISVEASSSAPPFRRGDAGADGDTTIADAIRILNFLFTGDTDLACKDAADSDDSGELEITDAIRLLGFLFLGEGEIPPPVGACGPDPTEDALGCGEAECPA